MENQGDNLRNILWIFRGTKLEIICFLSQLTEISSTINWESHYCSHSIRIAFVSTTKKNT